MVGQENLKSCRLRAAPQPGQPHTTIKAPGIAVPQPGQPHTTIKAPGIAAPPMGQQVSGAATVAVTGNQASPKLPSASNMNTEVLNQTRKMPFSPVKAAVGGFAVAMTLAYFTLYTKKKPEASAMDVARVVTGTSRPEHTRPRN
ncbi:hypothetical protein HAX54_011721 [Datura stramonium]|uniref:Uncharacterized protein n=1 Tax=Datura stramonium TaxID=4076 RepID=A0ABS8RX81_DATST|nr:hypothetical protein [Datura stramonium]